MALPAKEGAIEDRMTTNSRTSLAVHVLDENRTYGEYWFVSQNLTKSLHAKRQMPVCHKVMDRK